MLRCVSTELPKAPVDSPSDTTSRVDRRVQQLEEAIDARDDFLAVAAHELRSPLQALALRLAALERIAAGEGSDRLAAEIRAARRSADRYVRRAAVLLDVARLNAGQLAISRDTVDIRSLVEQVIEEHREDARHHGVDLRAEVWADGTGWWDPHMVDQILSNLVGNAIKYGRGAPVLLLAGIGGSEARFQVIDGGPGIAEKDRAKIFGKFERLVDTTRHSSGFGLGLWIVGSMVSALGGRVEVDSQPGRGSVFRVHLPLAAPPKGQGHTA
jgi:signal transduction histidine kinase